MESAALGRPFTRDGWSSRFELVSRFDAADGAGAADACASDGVVLAATKNKRHDKSHASLLVLRIWDSVSVKVMMMSMFIFIVFNDLQIDLFKSKICFYLFIFTME